MLWPHTLDRDVSGTNLAAHLVCFSLMCRLNRGSKCKMCAHWRPHMAVNSSSVTARCTLDDTSRWTEAEREARNEWCLYSAYSLYSKQQQQQQPSVVSDMEMLHLCSRGAWQERSYVLSGQTTCIFSDMWAWQGADWPAWLTNILLKEPRAGPRMLKL